MNSSATTPAASTATEQVFAHLKQYSTFGPWIECTPDTEGAVLFASQPVAAAPVAQAATDLTALLDRLAGNGYAQYLIGAKPEHIEAMRAALQQRQAPAQAFAAVRALPTVVWWNEADKHPVFNNMNGEDLILRNDVLRILAQQAEAAPAEHVGYLAIDKNGQSLMSRSGTPTDRALGPGRHKLYIGPLAEAAPAPAARIPKGHRQWPDGQWRDANGNPVSSPVTQAAPAPAEPVAKIEQWRLKGTTAWYDVSAEDKELTLGTHTGYERRTVYTAPVAQAVAAVPATDERFAAALKQTWQMVDPYSRAAPGSYAKGHQNGIADALKTIKENYDLASPAAHPATDKGEKS